MSNPVEEAAFEAAVYQYFSFKAKLAATAAKDQEELEALKKKTEKDDATPLAVLATAANDKEKTTESGDKEDDGSKKPAAKPTEKTAAAQTKEKTPPAKGQPTAPRRPGLVAPPTQPPRPAGPYPPMMPGMVPPPGQAPIGPVPPMMPPANMTAPPGFLPRGPPVGFPGVSPMLAAQQPPPQPPANLPSPSVMFEKYNRVVEAMKKEFPPYATGPALPHVPWEPSTRYNRFPQLQSETSFLRQRVMQLTLENQQMRNELGQRKQQASKKRRPPARTPMEMAQQAAKGDPESVPPPSKRTKRGKVYKSIHARPDVPDDVKKHISGIKEEARKERRSMKQKITRLQKQVNAFAVKPPPTGKLVLPPPPVPAVAAAAAPAAVVPKKPPPPKPEGPPASFESRFKELQDYKRANNTCRVPGRIPGLGRWCSDVRRNYRFAQEHPEVLDPNKCQASASELTQERIDRLLALGFEFDIAPKVVPWEERFEKLVAYKEKHGDTRVPRNYKEDPSLGEWVHMQRKLYKQNSKIMQGERTEKLNSVGFVWSGSGPKKVPWEDRLEECRDFRRQHGHLNVPAPPNPKKASEEEAAAAQTQEERSFQWWCHRQRAEYRKLQAGKQTSLDKKKAKLLDDMGFNWMEKDYGKPGSTRTVRGKPPNEDVYNEQIAKLKRVQELYGDCNDWKNIEQVYPGDKRLSYWIKTQRKQYKAWKKGEYSSLSAERRLLLEAVGFNFEPRAHYAPYGSKKKAAAQGAAGEAAAGEMEDDDEMEDDSGDAEV